MMFAGTAATIVAGAVAERMKITAYLAYAFLIVAIIYPIYGHWVWGGGWLSAMDTPLSTSQAPVSCTRSATGALAGADHGWPPHRPLQRRRHCQRDSRSQHGLRRHKARSSCSSDGSDSTQAARSPRRSCGFRSYSLTRCLQGAAGAVAAMYYGFVRTARRTSANQRTARLPGSSLSPLPVPGLLPGRRSSSIIGRIRHAWRNQRAAQVQG